MLRSCGEVFSLRGLRIVDPGPVSSFELAVFDRSSNSKTLLSWYLHTCAYMCLCVCTLVLRLFCKYAGSMLCYWIPLIKQPSIMLHIAALHTPSRQLARRALQDATPIAAVQF